METLWMLILVSVVLELTEVFLQRADTLYGVMQRLYGWYKKSIFLFFLIHPTFYFTLFVTLATDRLNLYMLVIIAMKVFDLFYKIELIRSIFVRQQIPADLQAMLAWKIPSWFFLTGVMLYPPLLYCALV